METQELQALIQQNIRETVQEAVRESVQETVREIVQETVRETMHEILRKERLALCCALMPSVSENEMEEIREQFGIPEDYEAEEFIDATDWVRNEAELD